jgi:very-short-patch-repair endonuclease
MKQLARELRKYQTETEALLWRRLRNRQIEGCKFRRQQIIEPYIVDFVCIEQKLIVELDEGQHVSQVEHDVQRTAFLESLGYKVIRFWNHEVLSETEVVLEKIRMELIRSPHPNPLPEGEGVE